MADDIDLGGFDSSRIGTSRVGTNVVLTPRESLTAANCDEFETMFGRIVQQEPPGLILDLKSVPVLDSLSLEMLIRIHDAMKGQGNALKLTNLNAVCRDILIVTRLINFLHVYEDVAEAARSR